MFLFINKDFKEIAVKIILDQNLKINEKENEVNNE